MSLKNLNKRQISWLVRLSALLMLVVMFFLLSLASCSDTGCIDNRSSIPYAGFYSYETKESITVDSLEIGGVGAPNDSLLVVARDRISAMYLPFRFEHDNTTFYIRYVSKALNYPWLVDSISFKYTSNPMFVSSECGAMYQYHVTEMKYTTHLIDSIALTDSLITNTEMERIKIYFRTRTDIPDQGNGDDNSDEGETEGDDNGEEDQQPDEGGETE